MIIGVPRETLRHEYRVALLPAGAEALTEAGHTVLVETGAGLGSGFTDADYRVAGARIAGGAKEIFRRAELILKVKQPQEKEFSLLQAGQVLFSYFHFAANPALTRATLASRSVAIAYETVQLADGTLPLLIPMSEIAGRMAVHEGARFLEEPFKGRGLLLGGVPGVAPAKVVILGGGVVGANAAKMAAGLGADVTVLDINLSRMRYLEDIMPPNVTTMMSDAHNIREQVRTADLLIGCILVPAARTPLLVRRSLVRQMKRGAVIVDVAIDQGGCVETSRPTTHERPTFIVDGVVHYCVTNMPGAVARTSALALCNATFPYVREIAGKGWRNAAEENPALAHGLNIVDGKIVHPELAKEYPRFCS